jgi:hypothetical protein
MGAGHQFNKSESMKIGAKIVWFLKPIPQSSRHEFCGVTDG